MADEPRVVERRVMFESRKFRVVESQMCLPGTPELEAWEHVEVKGSGGVRICAWVEEDDTLVLVREYRAAAGCHVLRFPSGAVEADETPDAAARRELEEEVGLRAGTLRLLCIQPQKSAYVKYPEIRIYLATELVAGSIRRDAGERTMEVVRLPTIEVYRMVDDLDIDDINTVYAVTVLRKWLGPRTPEAK